MVNRRNELRRRGEGTRGFSLMEVLLALFILGIGLVMVATIFPVGGEWTRQAVEENTAQTVARSAISTLQMHYAGTGDLSGMIPDFHSATVAAFPGVDQIWVGERAYQAGASKPFPVDKAQGATYFWTALARQSPNQPAAGKTLDVYILVFKKGAAEQQWGYRDDELAGTRARPMETFVPSIVPVDLKAAKMRAGEYGVAVNSGAVFRMSTGADGVVRANPALGGETQVLISPPADGTTVSPLVFIYQTTMSF